MKLSYKNSFDFKFSTLEKKGARKMKKKERVKDYGKLIIDLVDKIDDQNKLKRIYQFVKYIYVHF